MVKRTLAFIVALVMLGAFFAVGCSGTSPKGNSVIIEVPSPVPSSSSSVTASGDPTSDAVASDIPAETPAGSQAPASFDPSETSPAGMTDEPSPATAAPDPAAPTTAAVPTSVPTTDHPATNPPASSSPAPSAPATSTPVTNPPATNQPATNPPVTNPPATSAPTQNPGSSLDYSVFDNCAFVGNSTFEGLHQYGIIQGGAWFTRVGLNILTVYNTPTTTGSVPIIDELNTGSYEAVFLMFGQNELGWPNLDVFINKYEQLLRDIWRRQPNAKLFITGIPPVSQKVSDEGKNGVTNAHINYVNSGLEALAARTANAYYITVPSQLIGPGGALPNEASSDGIHLNLTYMRYWGDHICRAANAVLR